ncbi:nuclear transport factor 2 family protein [Kitasatospora sp. NPDC058115]|uniref:nuclear transport factor 2 family protein n=1 Tax=Kitasatospora sp. NPDC058115 TaxID=3346347 RepID=UPI0036DE73E4
MTIAPAKLSDPTVRAAVTAINAGDRQAFVDLLAPDATMSDDGSERDLQDWIDREIFTVHGHMEVRSESDGGRALVADYRNETWGEMRTAWRFTVEGGRISHFATGQA